MSYPIPIKYKWFIDYNISDDPLYCEIVYNEGKTTYKHIPTGDYIEPNLNIGDIFDTEEECLNAKIQEFNETWQLLGEDKTSPTRMNIIIQTRYNRCIANKKRINIQKFLEEL